MKPKKIRKRYFFDGYRVDPVKANDGTVMCDLTSKINRKYFDDRGYAMMAGVLDGKKPAYNGMVGMILSLDTHFVCRVFSQHRVFLADFFSLRAPLQKVEKMQASFTARLGCEELVFAEEKNLEHTDSATHLVIETSQIARDTAYLLLDQISAIIGEGMPITRPMSRTVDERFALLQVNNDSYVAIHSRKKTTVFDVYACRRFFTEEILTLLKNTGVPDVDWHVAYLPGERLGPEIFL